MYAIRSIKIPSTVHTITAANDRKDRRHPRLHHRDQRHIRTDHNNVAMGEVQHLRNPINHRIPKRYDRIDTSNDDSIKSNTI